MKRNFYCAKFYVLILVIYSATICHGQNVWSYVGIPYTDWEYDPFQIEMDEPAEWPSSPAEDFYYVAPDHPDASDDALPDETIGIYGRFGYPDRPRISIPSDGWIGDIYDAGTVIYLSGGTYGGDDNFFSTWSPEFHGSSTAPIWIYGDPDNKPIFSNLRIQMYNSKHLILDNLQWIGGNNSNTVLALTRDRQDPTHHITLRNSTFENLNYIGGSGAIIGLASNTALNAELHDVVAYKNTFKNCGGGFDWTTEDGDQHAFKVNGYMEGNEAYRIWIIDNTTLKGDTPDPIDGLYKSLSGNFVQVGDQIASSGGNHHVFVAGNHHEFGRQALGWTKRSSDVIFSGNYCTNVYALAGSNGQCYGHQYDLGTFNWWINNVGTQSSSGWQHTANNPMDGPLFVVGNQFYNNKVGESNNNWRLCSGISLWSQYGEHYIVNNVFDNSCHGIWAKTNRHTAADSMYIYNNIFTDISSSIDQTSRAITLENSNGIHIGIGNNLFDDYDSSLGLNNTSYTTLNDLNSQSWATENIEGDPLYIDDAGENFDISLSSPAIDAGTQSYLEGTPDVYEQYLNRYSNDPLYPGDPADYWPKDFLGKDRNVYDAIDIGTHENAQPNLYPRLKIEHLKYEGAFIIPGETQGESSAHYAEGAITLNGSNSSLFLAGHSPQGAIAEFTIPPLVNSTDINDLNTSSFVQGFKNFFSLTSNGNPQNINRVSGMEVIDGQLFVNAVEYYDAPANNSHTTFVVEDANDFANSLVSGYYSFEGAAHTAGWISDIPMEWKNALEGKYITGNSSRYPINGRNPMGVSAFSFDPINIDTTPDAITPTLKLMDFDLSDPLYADYDTLSSANYNILNSDGSTFTCHTFEDADPTIGSNELWTEVSQASFGFIVPNTRTYLTIGSSGGHQSGIGYKAEQDNGNCCGGPCAYEADDYYNYYWLWDVNDLLDVKNGNINPYDVRPYAYGTFDAPFQYDAYSNTPEFHAIVGGDFDPETGLLYLTIYDGGATGQYSKNPVIAAYQIIYEEVCDGLDNNANGLKDEHQLNSWIGTANGNWYDSPENWSLNHFPNSCNQVKIGSSATVNLLDGKVGYGYSLVVEQGATLKVGQNAELSIESFE